MTRDQTRAAAQIMLAWAEGKTVQWKTIGSSHWSSPLTTDSVLAWNFDLYEYRIKPEPREWWLNVLTGRFYAAPQSDNPTNEIKVREVIE